MKINILAAMVVGLTLTLAACGGDDDAVASGEDGLKTVRITNPANVSNAALHLAIDEGFFEDEGLKIEADVDLGAGSDTEAVIGGQVDMAWSNVVGALVPYSEGIPLQLVAVTDYAVAEYLEVLVLDDSPVKTLADLQGRSIAVLSPSTSCILAVQAAMDAEGLDASTVTFEVVPPQDQPTVLSSGKVDSTCSSDPTRTRLMSDLGARSVFDTSQSPLGDFAIGGYLVSREFAEKNPDIVDGFRTALAKATAMANAEPDLVREQLQGYAELEPELAQQVTITKYAEDLDDTAAVEALAASMEEFDMVSEPIDLTDFMYQ